MKRLLYLAFLPALLVACSKTSDQTPQGRYDQAIKQADRLEFAQAESTLVRLQRADSVTPLADEGLARTYEQKLWWLDALAHYVRLSSNHPDMASAAGGVTRCFYNLGSYYDAVRAAGRWIVLDPTSAQPFYWQALSLVRTMDLAGASEALNRAEQNGLDNAAARLIEARIKWLQGSYDASVATASPALSSGSKAAEYFFTLTDYYAERGIADSAVWAAQQGYATQPSSFSAWRCLETCGRFQRLWAARQLLTDWDARDKDKSVSNVLHFQYSLAADDKSNLSVISDQFLEQAPTAFSSLVFAALGYRSFYNDLTSADLLDQASGIAGAGFPESFKEYMGAYAGYSYSRSRDRDGAARQLMAIRGWRTETLEFRAAIYSQMTISGGEPQAEKMWDTLGPLHGRDPIWLTGFGDAYAYAMGVPFNMGQKWYRMALDVAPSYRPAFVGLVGFAVATRAYQDALNAFDSVRQFGPMTPDLNDWKAISLVRVGRIDEGITLFKQIFTQYPQDVETARQIVLGLNALRKPDQVRDLVQFCMSNAKENPDVFVVAARALTDWGFAPEGLQAARQGLQLEPGNLHLRAEEGRALYATNQKDQAKQVFDDILAKDESQGETVMYYSLLLAENRADSTRAELMAQSALRMTPPELLPARNLARVYLTMKRYINCREASIRAVVVSPKDPDSWYLMGISQFHEKLPEARENLQKAISLGLTGDDLTKAQEALRQL